MVRWALCIGAVLVAATGLASTEARACSPWDPELVRTFPAERGVLPSGAALLLHGHVLWPELLTVTVDGEPAALALLEEHSRGLWFVGWDWAYETMALRIEPTPRPGQTIVVAGDPCLRWEGMSFCDDVELVYTVGEPDVGAPDAPAELWYDVYDHGEEASNGGLCNLVVARFEITVHTELEREVLEYPLEYHLLRRPRSEPDAWTLVEHDWLLDAEAHDPGVRWQYPLHEVERLLPLAEAYCLRLQTFDASENLGGDIEVCPPCHDQAGPGDEGAGFIAWPDGAPPYDDASRYPGGYCPQALEPEGTTGEDGTDGTTGGDGDASSSTTGVPEEGETGGGDPSAEGVTDGGCGCTATREAPAWAWLWVLLGVSTAARRRRWQSLRRRAAVARSPVDLCRENVADRRPIGKVQEVRFLTNSAQVRVTVDVMAVVEDRDALL